MILAGVGVTGISHIQDLRCRLLVLNKVINPPPLLIGEQVAEDDQIEALAGENPRCMRDPTRGFDLKKSAQDQLPSVQQRLILADQQDLRL